MDSEALARAAIELGRPFEKHRRWACWAEARAAICGRCGRETPPGEPVWRRGVDLGPALFGGRIEKVVPVCADCAGEPLLFEVESHCDNCDRTVFVDGYDLHKRLAWLRPPRVWCSERCAWTYLNRHRSQARAHAREK